MQTPASNRKRQDEIRRKPVLALALIEHHLRRADADGEQPEADVIDLAGLARAWSSDAADLPPAASVSSSDTIATGTLMKKIQRQSKLSVIYPPSVGPIAGASTTAMP